jgi:hypothetical protein
MDERRSFRGLPVAGVAASGVVLGHWLAYTIAVPQPEMRAEILLGSGHAYWFMAVKLALILGLSGLGALAIRHLSCSLPPRPARGLTFSWLTLRLALLQIAAFSAMEVFERMASGAPVAGMLQHRVFLLGVALQVLVACVGALGLLLFGRAVARAAATLRRTGQLSPRDAVPLGLLPTPVRPVPLLEGASGVRGPPSR